jgi:hypothetical protein
MNVQMVPEKAAFVIRTRWTLQPRVSHAACNVVHHLHGWLSSWTRRPVGGCQQCRPLSASGAELTIDPAPIDPRLPCSTLNRPTGAR